MNVTGRTMAHAILTSIGAVAVPAKDLVDVSKGRELLERGSGEFTVCTGVSKYRVFVVAKNIAEVIKVSCTTTKTRVAVGYIAVGLTCIVNTPAGNELTVHTPASRCKLLETSTIRAIEDVKS